MTTAFPSSQEPENNPTGEDLPYGEEGEESINDGGEAAAVEYVMFGSPDESEDDSDEDEDEDDDADEDEVPWVDYSDDVPPDEEEEEEK